MSIYIEHINFQQVISSSFLLLTESFDVAIFTVYLVLMNVNYLLHSYIPIYFNLILFNDSQHMYQISADLMLNS